MESHSNNINDSTEIERQIAELQARLAEAKEAELTGSGAVAQAGGEALGERAVKVGQQKDVARSTILQQDGLQNNLHTPLPPLTLPVLGCRKPLLKLKYCLTWLGYYCYK